MADKIVAAQAVLPSEANDPIVVAQAVSLPATDVASPPEGDAPAEGAGLTFKTRIKIKGRAFVNRLNQSRLELFPRMQISSAMKIAEQNLGEYLLRPISSQLHYTFPNSSRNAKLNIDPL